MMDNNTKKSELKTWSKPELLIALAENTDAKNPTTPETASTIFAVS
jgi:hypothetical protein